MSDADRMLWAGTGRRCTNPPPNIAHGGWGAQKHEQAEGIDMDLWVTALALAAGETRAILIDLDIQILTNQRADQIRSAVNRATGVPFSNIRASATHTHSGPVPYKSWIEKGYEMVDPWFGMVAEKSAEAAQEAIENLCPVRVRSGCGQCHINANRRAATPEGERFLGIDPDGSCDHEVIVTTLSKPDDEPMATLAHFACHPTIMGPSNRLITPDYPGATKRVVEEAVGGRCIFLQGAAGDQGPVQGFQGNPKVYRCLGAILGHEIVKVALGLNFVPYKTKLREVVASGAPLGMYDSEFNSQEALPLQVHEDEIQVPLRKELPERTQAGEKLDFWKKRLAESRAKSDEAAITEATCMARRSDIELRMADDFGGRTTAGVRTHFITFGNVALVGCNIEPFCDIGLAVKQNSPFPVTCLSGYTNGRMAYMPTRSEWHKGGYEVENSPFGENAAELLTERILEILKSLKGKYT